MTVDSRCKTRMACSSPDDEYFMEREAKPPATGPALLRRRPAETEVDLATVGAMREPISGNRTLAAVGNHQMPNGE